MEARIEWEHEGIVFFETVVLLPENGLKLKVRNRGDKICSYKELIGFDDKIWFEDSKREISGLSFDQIRSITMIRQDN